MELYGVRDQVAHCHLCCTGIEVPTVTRDIYRTRLSLARD